MPLKSEVPKPKTFFLNEHHELTRAEKPAQGRLAVYLGVNWRAKGNQIAKSLGDVRQHLRASRDPIRSDRFFVLANPTRDLFKRSSDKNKAVEGRVPHEVDYAAQDSKVFGRLGLDLIQVNPDGTATVHARGDAFDRLLASSEQLDALGPREKARWATIDRFTAVPSSLRVDREWLRGIGENSVAEALVEFQPLLGSADVDRILRVLNDLLDRRTGERILGIGTDFSGRHWLRGRINRNSIESIAKEFFSIQSIHPPLFSVTLASPKRHRDSPHAKPSKKPTRVDAANLPCVAVLDTGVPSDHLVLSPYRRGQFIDPDSIGQSAGNHGSMVASRVVFGDLDLPTGLPEDDLVGSCSFYDVNVASSPTAIVEKSVLRALEAVIGTAPDVRVFNLSFDNVRALELEPAVQRAEKLRLVQDLDNFIFARDVLVVTAAGNSPINTPPNTPYPRHYEDPRWFMGTWPRSFNSLTCGSTSDRLHPEGLANQIGAPSPFTRAGPGLCGSPKPDFSAHGGNSTPQYNFKNGLGVWGCSASALWEDYPGTSFAAPLLAREAAIAFHNLQPACSPGSRPFGVLVKAFLALTAVPPDLPAALQPLADRTLGRGVGSAQRLSQPRVNSAVIVWQGTLQAADDLARVHVPIPLDWLADAEAPKLRVVVAWDSPVNAGVEGVWACRKVSARLHVALNTPALRGAGSGHKSYPLIDRTYDLKRLPENIIPEDDMWVLELNYEEIAEYYPGIDFTPHQRVAFAAELFDDSDHNSSPQALLQSLPAAATMIQLSAPAATVRTPVIIKARV